MWRRLEIGFALLLAVSIGLAVWLAHRTPQPPTIDFRKSTMIAGPLGSRGLYDVLVRLGRPVQRRRTSLFDLTDAPRLPALLVELDPPFSLQDAEVEEIVSYVQDGGAVLSAGRGGGLTACAGWRLQPDGFSDDSVTPAHDPGAPTLPRSARVLARRRSKQLSAEKLQSLVKERAPDEPCDSLVAVRSETLLVSYARQPI